MKGWLAAAIGILVASLRLSGCSGDGRECDYDTDCTGSQVCRNSKCVDPADACEGVRCEQPPGDAACYELPGECLDGTCVYAPLANETACESDDGCILEGACLQGVCAGEPIDCRIPPGASCVDDSTLRTYASRGECVEGECVYGSNDVTCSRGCDVDHCIDEPCAGKICNGPPNDQCYPPTGDCVADPDARCVYTPLEDGTGCDDGDACTLQDACTGGQCGGEPMQCNSPPPNSCDGDVAIIYERHGTCRNGQCEYGSQRVDCGAGGCQSGQCAEPCAGVVCDSPPNTQCYEATGTCVALPDVHCEYTLLGEGADCDDGDACTLDDSCSDGVCRGTSVRCDDPPDDYCEDANTLAVFESSGTCCEGECEYSFELEVCEHGCFNGACCIPGSCGAHRCGVISDGCGGTLDCGSCPDPDQDCESHVCVCNNTLCAGDCCAPGQWCDDAICHDCDSDQHCGPSCVDCSANSDGHACIGGACGCASESDCSYPRTCNIGAGLCVVPESLCHDGVDNDDDGLTDCADDDCDGHMCDLSSAYGAACYHNNCRMCEEFTCEDNTDCPPGCDYCNRDNFCEGAH
ncbi:MAG: hypothetical protein JXR96_13310 [Deltaproteobacteria bacterium]|nr:hypothetical protein [Deltaproteobacteria bacterium]